MTFTVGTETVFVVGVEGLVEAVDQDAETVTIAGVTLPVRLDSGRGVKYLSVVWPDELSCEREHCGDFCDGTNPNATEAIEERDELADAIRADHDEHHDGVLRYCQHATCRAVAS